MKPTVRLLAGLALVATAAEALSAQALQCP